MSDLIGLWRLDKGSGLIAFDTSGYGNDGDLEGANPTWVDGISKKCVNFPGANERMDCGNGAPLDDLGNGDFSISFWMKSKDTVPLSLGRLFSKHEDALNYMYLSSYLTENRLYFEIKKGGLDANAGFNIATQPFNVLWNHIVLVLNRTTDKVILYWNSVKDSVEVDISSLPADCSNAGNLAWGAIHTGAKPYEGLIDECRIYNGVLIEGEITLLFNNPAGIPLGKMTPWLVSSRLAGVPDSMAAKVIPPSIVSVAKEAGEPL